jgi:hypothetical protein
MTTLVALAVVLATNACMRAENDPPRPPDRSTVRDYWYNRGAEISRFKLVQARYGRMHSGHAVHVFVTEPMNPVRQVKPDQPGPDSLPVLKLNAQRFFYTGIYPYSVITSVFAPMDVSARPLPPKITTSVQEWCGHTFMQFNLGDDRYRVRGFSYFESEGDVDETLEAALPEDALWTRVRLAPETLPVGTFRLIPGTVYLRFAHRPVAVVAATGELKNVPGKSLEGRPLAAYTVKYETGGRRLRIVFERGFPHRIQEWTESDGTRAVRTHTIMTDYWNHNSDADRPLLRKLGLEWHAHEGPA